jgi:glycosyltransferase involved in cell wall biosynthesis
MSDASTPRISVVVPTRNSSRTLRACLSSARHQTLREVEIVVVDNGSTDDTASIAGELADIVLDHGPERSAQRNRGWRAARAELIVFIDSDMVLEPNLLAEAVSIMATDDSLRALVVPEVAFGDGFLASCRGLEKRLYLGDSDTEAARVFRRDALEAVGGYTESLTACEDWDLADRVHASGGGIGRTLARVRHDEGRVSLRRTFEKKRYYGRWLAVYLRMRTPDRRRRLVRSSLFRRPGALLRQPHLTAGLLVLKVTELAGLMLGMHEGPPVGPS